MPNKIFISYNHNDKVLIDTIARRLELEFGRNNIFYDAWSIQPGDSIIGKMNEGLGDFKTFFFFVSPNSLQSKMVSLEWQTALNRAVNEQLKFVAVRIADCPIPAILTDKAYIDLYGEGLDDAIEKMKLVVKSENTYKPLQDVENVVGEYHVEPSGETLITIRAQYFNVNNPDFAFAAANDYDDFCVKPLSEGFVHTYRTVITKTETQIALKAHGIGLCRDLKPGFPLVVCVTPKNPPIKELTVFLLKNQETRLYYSILLSEKK